jgi:probable F420-dependent oxidoreductase
VHNDAHGQLGRDHRTFRLVSPETSSAQLPLMLETDPMQVHPFRFIAALPVLAGDVRAWEARVRRIEDLGYGAASISDHVIDGWSMDPFVSIACAAMATTRLRLLSLVLANDYRHPVLVHRAIASLDVVSGGRVELGMGTGWLPAEYEALGLQLDAPRVRVDRLGEAVGIIKGLFGDSVVEAHGRHYSVGPLMGLPRPVQEPRPPLLIGGGSPSILALAGREADIAGIFPPRGPNGLIEPEALAPARTAQRTAMVLNAARDAGRPPGSVRLQLNLLAWDLQRPGEASATGQSKVASATLINEARRSDLPGVLVGSVAEACDRIEAWRGTYGFSEIHVGSAIDLFAPVVERLAGR